MDHEASRTSSASGDYEEDAEEDYEDDEATLDEEESKYDDDLDNVDELALLAEESAMSVEELRRRYLGEEALNLPSESSSSTQSSPNHNSVEEASSSNYFARKMAEAVVASSASYFTDEILNDENDDEEYEPPDSYRKSVDCLPEVQLSSNYLSESNGCSNEEFEGDDDGCHAKTLWVPEFNACSVQKLERYLSECEKARYESQRSASSSSLAAFSLNYPSRRNMKKDLFDDESALYALYKANYEVEKAKEKAPFPCHTASSVNGARMTYTEPWRQFTEEDCTLFEKGLRTYGKNFFAIRTDMLEDRVVGELVRFYYVWKKTERHDMFIAAQRNESVSTTDFMGNIMNAFIGCRNNSHLNSQHSNKIHQQSGQISGVLAPLKDTSEWLNVKNIKSDLPSSIAENV